MRRHDTPLLFNFKYFFIGRLRHRRLGRQDAARRVPPGLQSVALRDRRRELDREKRLNAGTPDVFSTLKKYAGTSIKFHVLTPHDACLTPARHATPWSASPHPG